MPRESYHHGTLRDALLGAAESAISQGREPALRELARMLGVSPNAPYRHFPNRQALIEAIAERGFGRLADRIAGRDLSDALAEYFAFAAAEPTTFRLMFSIGPASHLPGPEATRAFGELCRAVDGAMPPGRSTNDITSSAVFAWSAIHGYAALWGQSMLREFETPGEPEVERIAASVRASLEAKSAG